MGFWDFFFKSKPAPKWRKVDKNFLLFLRPKHLPDRFFHLPPEEELGAILKKLWAPVACRSYVAELWDCENFAEHFKVEFQKIAADLGYNAAVSVVKYKRDSGGWHAINLVVTACDKLVFIEPQKCKVIELSKDEHKTILNGGFIRF